MRILILEKAGILGSIPWKKLEFQDSSSRKGWNFGITPLDMAGILGSSPWKRQEFWRFFPWKKLEYWDPPSGKSWKFGVFFPPEKAEILGSFPWRRREFGGFFPPGKSWNIGILPLEKAGILGSLPWKRLEFCDPWGGSGPFPPWHTRGRSLALITLHSLLNNFLYLIEMKAVTPRPVSITRRDCASN